ncbi:MAG: hypothetical protein ACYTKD_18620 [Planctomycetota bacterium]|jgi:hypothetical protein
MSDAARVEELTLALLDGREGKPAEADAMIKELECLTAADERAMEVHASLVELEGLLRGEAEARDTAEAVVARIKRELERRVERGVMARISGVPKGGGTMDASTESGAGPRGSGRLWLAAAAAGIAVAVAVGLVAYSSLRSAPALQGRGLEWPAKDDGAAEVTADAAKPAGAMAEIPLTLPKPAFIGTPKMLPPGVNLKRSEEGDDKPRPPFMAPADVKNVALGKAVACSDEEPIIGDPEQVTDGDKEAGDGSYVEFGPGTQHVTLDLGEKHEVFAVVVWHYHGDPRVYHDIIVQVADDPDFITGVKAIFNNDHDNSSGLGLGKNYEYFETREGLLVDAGGVETRYIRLYSNGSTVDEMNRYAEVEVYGRPASE